MTFNSNTDYNYYWGGTSQASPLVAGIASLLLSQDSTRTPDQIYQIIRDSADDQVGDPAEDVQGYDIYHGYGRVNAYQALSSGLSVTENILKDLLSVSYTHLTLPTILLV